MNQYKTNLSLTAAVLLLALSFSARAMDTNGNYAVWSVGKKSCYSYSKAREGEEQDKYKTFIMGYLTAYNAITAETYSISGSMTLPQILEWLDDYCELKPVHSFELALTEFLTSHKEKRMKHSPVGFGR